MNLYRSFGNLLEAWVTDGAPNSDWLERNDNDSPLPPLDTNVRSESVDSGVETASSDISFPTTSVSADMDAFTPEKQETPMSLSPVLSFPALPSSSSSSPCFMPTRSKAEEALLRTESMRQKRQPVTVEEVLMRRPQSSLLPKRHASDLVRGQRSGSFRLRKAVSPSLLMRHMSDVQKRPQSAIYDRQTSETIPEALVRGEKSELSPGLQYLEQVCQMLEEYARQQLHNNSLQTEMEAVVEAQESQEEEAAGVCQTDAAQMEASCQSLRKAQVEPSSSVPQQRGERPFGHFRQRSASDTNLTSLHLRRLKLDYKEEHLSSHDLREMPEEDQENQECQKNGINKTKKYWRFNFGSTRKEDLTKSQQMLPVERSSTRRRLSQLFRRRRKTGPV